MSLRFLVVEGNVEGPRERHRDTFGKTYAESYGAVLQHIEKDAVYDIALPADEGANIPDAAGLEGYDGISSPVRRSMPIMRRPKFSAKST